MIEVTSKNFESVFPHIKKAIESSSFIALDTEFSGLPSAKGKTLSLFDTLEDRYQKLRTEIPEIIICQFGLTTFSKDISENRYNADIFQFYLRPSSFGSVEKWFSIQVSAIKFLCSYKFDFNKCFNDGLSYLNEVETHIALRDIKNKNFLQYLSGHERDNILEVCSQANKWLLESKDITMVLDSNLIQGVDDYIVFNIIKEKNLGCWVYRDDKQNVILERVSLTRRLQLEQESTIKEDTRYFESLLGFSKVFQVLVNTKKPIVGHNCLCDLLLIFNQFYRPLPVQFKSFKKDINSLFPLIFDTKHISHSIKREFEEVVQLGRGDLAELYTTLRKSNTSSTVCYSPLVKVPGSREVEVSPHHAGFDSFACGFVFLKLSHQLALKNLQSQPKPMTWTEHLDAISLFKNRINLIRADNHFLDLQGVSLPSGRPKWLHIHSNSITPLNVEKLTELLSSYGTIDVKLLNQSSALLAVGNWACARDIVKAFHRHQEFRVTSYSPLHHSTPVRLALWSALACCSGVSLFLLFKLLRT